MNCTRCGSKEIDFNFSEGKIACTFCGCLLEDNLINPELTFETKNTEKHTMNGKFVRNSLQSSRVDPAYRNTEIILSSARRKINQVSNLLKLQISHQEEAHRFFVFLFQKGVVLGHKMENVCIACLYAVCRKEKTPHLLIDFSDITQIQTHKIGAFFLKFIRILNLNLPVIDPSLFVYRFVAELALGNKSYWVAKSSLRLIARMKREWMNSGRRPAGLCGAAILLAAKMHGVPRTHQQISEVVRIGNIALRSRLREIDISSMGKLTIHDIDAGGGDDGNRNSLFDWNDNSIHSPPSFDKISRSKEFERRLEEKGTILPIIQKKGKKNKKQRSREKNREKEKKRRCSFMSKNSKKTGFSDTLLPILSSSKKKVSFANLFLYLNSRYEMFIKENIWNEINLPFLYTHSIFARVQKEKPFAYYRMKISKKNSD
jgi:transcription factor IIIB subunit 2